MSLLAPKIQGTTTINYIVSSVLNRLRNYSMRDYSFIEQIVIENFIDLNIWHLNNMEVVYLRMSEAKTVDLPADYVDYSKIGIPVAGKLKILTQNKGILLPRKFEDGEDVGNADDVTGTVQGLPFIDHYKGGQFVAGLYGLPGGLAGAYFDIDRETRKIIFSGSVPRGEIVLEYISTGVSIEGGTIIPREAAPALRNYAIWQLIEHDSTVAMNEKERKKAQYEEALNELRSFQTTFSLNDYRRMVYRSIKQSIKR